MQWVKMSEWYIQGEHGYRVSKAMTAGQLKYSAWGPKPGDRQQPPWMGTFDIAKAAMKCCEQHWQSTVSKPAEVEPG